MPSSINVQIDRRRQRALKEITRIANKGNHPIFSLFDVSSLSGRTYEVQIRSLSEMQNSCSCQDYRTNLIGTCKHIEAVLLHLKKKHRGDLKRMAQKAPLGAQIYLRYEAEETVRVVLPPSDRSAVRELLGHHFDPDGVLVGSPLQTLPALLSAIEGLAPKARTMVQVDEAVREYLGRLQDQEEIARQKTWFLEQMRKGARSLDVMSTRLYPFQESGAMHLVFGRRALLADDMGLGKTVQAIAASALLKELRGIQRALIICPASLKHQWSREIRRFTSLPVKIVEGGLMKRRAFYEDPAFFTILNYEIVRRDIKEIENLRPDLIILDEAQRIKNWRTKTATTVKRLQSRYAFVLTGTPLENRLDELYSIFQFIDPRILGPLWHFNDRFFELEERRSGTYKVLGYRNLDELRRTIAPYTLRRTREEVLQDLPSRVDNNFFVEMTQAQLEAYKEYKETVARLAAKARRRPLLPKEQQILLNSLVKMRLICNALALHDKKIPLGECEKTAPKLRELGQILSDQILENGNKAIVFSQWAEMLGLVEPVMKRLGLGYVKLTGDVPSAKRGDLIQCFFEDPDCRVFLSTDAGGLGLNLQAASLVINLDLPWNPAVLEQRIGRAHRHGQKKSVQVVNLVAQGTIEERMLDTLAGKRNVFAGVFGKTEAPESIHFEDGGQALLKQLDKLLDEPIKAELTLEPPAPPIEEKSYAPTLKDFADLLLTRLADRLLVVRKAPRGNGIMVVVRGAPLECRPIILETLRGSLGEKAPELHLLEEEGYRALITFLSMDDLGGTEDIFYRASALPSAIGEDGLKLVEKRRNAARNGLEAASKRLSLAHLVLTGGFAEEFLRPLREALGWAYSSLLTLYDELEPRPDLPSPRVIQAGLVEKGHLPEDLAMRLARVRELTEPEHDGGKVPPPSIKTGEAMVVSVRSLIDVARQKEVEMGM